MSKIVFEDRTKPAENNDELAEMYTQLLSSSIYMMVVQNGPQYGLCVEDVLVALFMAGETLVKGAVALGDLKPEQIEGLRKRASIMVGDMWKKAEKEARIDRVVDTALKRREINRKYKV